jgi:hypothetical protein
VDVGQPLLGYPCLDCVSHGWRVDRPVDYTQAVGLGEGSANSQGRHDVIDLLNRWFILISTIHLSMVRPSNSIKALPWSKATYEYSPWFVRMRSSQAYSGTPLGLTSVLRATACLDRFDLFRVAARVRTALGPNVQEQSLG